MDRDAESFPVFDATRPSWPRVYDGILGGKDNFAADRELAAALEAADPPRRASAGVLASAGVRGRARDNRAFVLAAARRAAGAGVAQFLDLRCGMPRPAGGNVHDAAWEVNPDARVVYVDQDPLVLNHARARLAKRPGLGASGADPADPAAVLADPDVLAVINPQEPVAVVMGTVLHFLGDDTAKDVCAKWGAAITPGSWLAAAAVHFQDTGLLGRLRDAYAPNRFYDHTPDVFTSFFDGLHLVCPGITTARRWAGNMDEGLPGREAAHVLAGVAIKP